MLRAVLLPGLDGCAELRTEFVDALGPDIQATVIALPSDIALGCDELVAHAEQHLPDHGPFLLIGESFSGPIAIKLAAKRPDGLAGLVLSATFARTPVPAAAPLRHLTALLPLRAMPIALIMGAMMGRWSTPDWSRRLGAALQGLDDKVFRRRIVEVMRVDVTEHLSLVSCPLLGITARSDRVLWFDGWKLIHRARPNATRIEIEGPHMLLQANAQECAGAINQWVRHRGIA